eukprot:TRINITY_DN28974_c0_g1_i1.p1 TRINITY_DN28974_c0_g1~~TRINITY_DN28974_c0_g1_i1.p1  ORF type:complete len:501 (-),score=118.42 TRINITY_DN28974_c0_g1_i1:182-1684(-)
MEGAGLKDAEASLLPKSQPSTRAGMNWKKAQKNVMFMVKIKQAGISLYQDTKKMRQMRDEGEKQRYIAKIIVIITVLGVLMTMTKSALFHMKAVGRWDDGHAYKFSYALTLTMTVFLMKMLLAPIRRFLKPQKDVVPDEEDEEEDDEEEEVTSWKESVYPWVLLVTFTFFEMLMATFSSLGLLYGAPTSIFIIFKSSKAIFMAILSWAILRRHLNQAQWASLVLIALALGVSTIAEGKGGGKGSQSFNILGPLLLLISEMCHACMLIFQEIAVKEYWPDSIELLSWSATFGVVMTGITMYKTHDIWVDLPDGGKRPFDDPMDVFYMMTTSPVLAFALLLNISTHLSSDVAHIMILKHISALARSLCDTLKILLMWALGKLFYFCAILPVLAEAWHPGLLGSWLMIPVIVAIAWAMLMFKNGVYVPIYMVKASDGSWKLEQQSIQQDEEVEAEERETVNLDDPFYMEAFRSRKLKKELKEKHHHAKKGALAKIKLGRMLGK